MMKKNKANHYAIVGFVLSAIALLLLICNVTFGQQIMDTSFEVTGSRSNYYFVTVNDDTVSQHLTLYKAIQSAHQYANYDKTDHVEIRQSLTLAVTHGDPEPIRGVFWTTSQQQGATAWNFGLQWRVNAAADTTWVRSICVSDNQTTYQEYGAVIRENGEVSTQHNYFCNQELFFEINVTENGELYTHIESVKL